MAAVEIMHFPSPGSDRSSTLVVTPHLGGIKMPIPGLKGHIEPHRTNLPRLGPRKKLAARKPSSPSSSSSSSSPLPTSSVASSSRHAAVPDDAGSVQEQVPAAAVAMTSPPTAPKPSPLPAPSSLTNLPRRRPINTPHRRRRAWQIRSHMQELLPQSNLWSCFSAFDEDSEEAAVMRDFDRIVRIRSTTEDKVETIGKTLTISIHKDLCHDHGVPNITQDLLVQAWKFLQDTDHSSASSARPRTLIVTSHGQAVDAVAIAAGYLLLSSEKDSKILDLLCQLQDLDEDSMQEAWRGVLSSDGVECIEEALDVCRGL